MSVQAKHFYQFGPFRLDTVKRRLMRDGELVKLTPKAFETLLALVEKRGKTIEKDELLNKVWTGTRAEKNTLNQSITAV
jgi:DNA-binding winged helix-turn-helix (wHTH) protein